MSSDIGIYGLTSQGIQLALNFASKGYQVTVGNKSSDKIKECIEQAEKVDLEEKIRGIKDVEDFCKNLKTPRRVLLLARPGSSVDRNMQKILPLLEEGDLLIDGSCDSVQECDRRSQEAGEKGVHFMTMAIAGSDVDARNGPAFLPSGPKEVYDMIAPMFDKVAAEFNHHACVGHIGLGSAAVLIKSLCNALEIGENQLLAEQYDLMRQMRLNNTEMSNTFAQWNRRLNESYLLEITSTIVAKKDCDVDGCKPSDNFLVERIIDQAPQKKTGCLIAAEGAEVGASASVLESAAFARYASIVREQRQKVQGVITAPKFDWGKLDMQEVLKDMETGYECARLVMYAQAFAILSAASKARGWEVKCGEVARVLAAGNLLRCALLGRIAEAYEEDPAMDNLLLSSKVQAVLEEKQTAWRRVMSLTVMAGVTAPTGMAALAYLDGMQTKRLSGAMVQCLRDCIGEEGFERVDKEKGEVFSCRWNK